MKTLDYIKDLMYYRIAAYKQVEANPEIYDKATQIYAKALMDETIAWYEERIKQEQKDSK